jgi:PAS domain S-box-containing protein
VSTNVSSLLKEKLKATERHLALLEAEIQTLRSCLKAAQESGHSAPSALIESITDAFVALDRDCRYIWINREAERLMGMPRDQVIGKVMWDVFPGALKTPLEEHCRAALSERRTVEFENYYPPLDRWFWNKAYPTNEGGLAIYWRDITEQKRSHETLVRQALILSQVHDSIITTDLTGNIQTWNQGAEQITGYLAEDVLGKHIAFLFFEEDRNSVAARVLEPLAQVGRLQMELKNQHKSGREIYLRLSLSLLHSESGQASGVIGVATDITEQKQVERALFESEERYRSLANSIPQIAYITSPGGKTEFVNQHWQRHSGLSPDSCRDFDWMSWIHPDDANALMTLWMESVHRGEPFQAEYRLRSKDGSYRWQLGRALPVRDASGHIVNWAGTVTDIDDQKNAETELVRSTAQLRRANQDLLHFAYAVSHDLQTPLRTIRSFSELLALSHRGKLGAESDDHINWIVGAASRMNTVLNDLVKFAQAAGGEIDPNQKVDLEAALSDALQNLQAEIEESHAVVNRDPLPTIPGEVGMFSAVFQNLIGNSLKYRKTGCSPAIRISAKRTGDSWQISVRDNGIGFEPEFAERIFGVFRRLHGQEFAGTGMGLAICQKIVERIGGRIWADSEPGEGAVFTFSVPAHR